MIIKTFPLYWTETTTKTINVKKTISKGDFNYTIQEWIDINKKLGLSKMRTSCNCCHVNWDRFENKDSEKIVFVFTDKGNKIICRECAAAMGVICQE